MKHRDRVALITGSTRGIGRAAAIRFAGEGAHVAVNGRSSHSAGEEVVQAIKSRGGIAKLTMCDVAQGESVQQLVKQTISDFGRIDIAIWNASLNLRQPFLDHTDDEFDAVHAANFSGFYRFARAVLPGMKTNGFGRIILTTSAAPNAPSTLASVSGASKAACITLMKYLAHEFAPFGITSNAVSPGLTDTDLAREFGLTDPGVVAQSVPMGRLADPDEVAAAMSYLASEDAAYVTGQVIQVTGGRFIGAHP